MLMYELPSLRVDAGRSFATVAIWSDQVMAGGAALRVLRDHWAIDEGATYVSSSWWWQQHHTQQGQQSRRSAESGQRRTEQYKSSGGRAAAAAASRRRT